MVFKLVSTQKYWDVVGDDILNIVLDFHNGVKSISAINQTFITLILKVKRPESMSQFRPISLCNSFYKIISKTLANRMKFPEIISQNQSVFVKGRQISDNIIAHEILRFLRVGKSKDNFLVIKIDMNKAYDRVKWPMVTAMMKKVGFNEKLRN